MSISDEKLKSIQSIHDLWSGLLINSGNAMHQIGEVLKENHVEMSNVKFINTETGECVATAESISAVIERSEGNGIHTINW